MEKKNSYTVKLAPAQMGEAARILREGNYRMRKVEHTVAATEDGPQVERYDSNTVYTLEGSLALQYAIAPGVALQGGYRAQQLWNAGVRYDQVDKDGDFESGEADILVHGAFVRVNLSF